MEEIFRSNDFSVPYTIPEGLRKEWPCFVILVDRKIVGFRSFEFHQQGGKKYAWVGSTSMMRGWEGRGLGPILFGRANGMVHALKHDTLDTWAHDPRAKRFWARQGYTRVEGEALDREGNTHFQLDLAAQRKAKGSPRTPPIRRTRHK